VVRVAFEPKAMGCISCVTKVRKVLERHSAVMACSVSLPNASAAALLAFDHQDSEAPKVAAELVDQASDPSLLSFAKDQ
jgi:copper chaperone CopZ